MLITYIKHRNKELYKNIQNYNDYTKKLYNIFKHFFCIICDIKSNGIKLNQFVEQHNIIIFLILFGMNNVFLLNKLIIYLKTIIIRYKESKYKYLKQIYIIENYLNDINSQLISLYSDVLDKDESSDLKLLINLKNKYICYNLDNIDNTFNNLDLYQINTLTNNIYDIDKLINKDNRITNIFDSLNYIYQLDDNYVDYKEVNIGFNNYYKLHCFNKLLPTLPFNLLMYINELDQVVIKIGNNISYRYINSKLYKIYNNSTKNINVKSILCNNNIKYLNKKCYLENCKYYHDYILGYKDNSHQDRQFSSNPIVHSCLNFKDGSKIKGNVNKVNWHEAINLYQSSLSNLLIGCIHSLHIKK